MKQIYFLFVVLLVVMTACGGSTVSGTWFHVRYWASAPSPVSLTILSLTLPMKPSTSPIYKAKERFKDIFDKAEQIRELDDAESCYQSGDTFFEDEHNAWERHNKITGSLICQELLQTSVINLDSAQLVFFRHSIIKNHVA